MGIFNNLRKRISHNRRDSMWAYMDFPNSPNPRFRSKHKRSHRNFYGLFPQQQAKISSAVDSKLRGII